MPLYVAYSFAAPTTAAPVAVATVNGIKTVLSVTAGSNNPLKVVKWGVSIDGTGTTPVKCELITTTTVAGTSTAGAAFNYGVDMATAATSAVVGYNHTVEGSVVATTRVGDIQQILPGNYFQNEWSLGREFLVDKTNVVRVRLTDTAVHNAYAFVLWEE